MTDTSRLGGILRNDWNQEFSDLVKNQLQDVVQLGQEVVDKGIFVGENAPAISLWELTKVTESLNEAAYFLNKFTANVLSQPQGVNEIGFPDELLPVMPRLMALSEEVSDILHEVCCECHEEDDDDDEDSDTTEP